MKDFTVLANNLMVSEVDALTSLFGSISSAVRDGTNCGEED